MSTTETTKESIMTTAIVATAVALLKAFAIVRAAGDEAKRWGPADLGVYTTAFYDACAATGIAPWSFFDIYCPVSDDDLRNADILAAFDTVLAAVGPAGGMEELKLTSGIDYERTDVCFRCPGSIAYEQTVAKGLI